MAVTGITGNPLRYSARISSIGIRHLVQKVKSCGTKWPTRQHLHRPPASMSCCVRGPLWQIHTNSAVNTAFLFCNQGIFMTDILSAPPSAIETHVSTSSSCCAVPFVRLAILVPDVYSETRFIRYHIVISFQSWPVGKSVFLLDYIV